MSNVRQQSIASEGLSAPTWVRIIASLLAGALMITGLTLNDSSIASAAGAKGTITEVSVSVTDDGTETAYTGDDSTTNGKVALKNSVVFDWQMKLQGVQSGQLIQTLPEGFTWDTASLNAAGLSASNPQYSASYTLSSDKRTLTATISSAVNATGAQIIEFAGLKAAVGTSESYIGAQYTPSLTVIDESGSRSVSATAGVTVVGTYLTDVAVGRASNTAATGEIGSADFGSGTETSVYQRLNISLTNLGKNGTAGLATYTWPDSVVIHNALDLTLNGSELTTVPVITLVSGTTTPSGATATLTNNSDGTFDITFSGLSGMTAGNLAVAVDVHVPKSLVADQSSGAPLINYALTVSEPASSPWTSSGGAQLNDDNTRNNVATGTYAIVPSQDVAATTIVSKTEDQTFGNSMNGYTFTKDSQYRQRTVYQAESTRDENGQWVPNATSGVNVYSFWNPSETTITGTPLATLGNGSGTTTTLAEGTDYKVYYTTDSYTYGSTDPSTLQWTERSAFGTDLSAVTGVRYEYIGDDGVLWKSATASSNASDFTFAIFPQYKVIKVPDVFEDSSELGKITHYGYVRAGGTANFTYQGSTYIQSRAANAAIAKSGVVLNEDGTSTGSTVGVAGQKVRYTITPTLTFSGIWDAPSSDAWGEYTIEHVIVDDVLPTNVVVSSLDFSELDPVWAYSLSTTDGVTTIRFSYQGMANLKDNLTPIQFDVQTSKVAPDGGTFTNVAGIMAGGIFNLSNGKPSYYRSASATLTVSQPSTAQYEKSTTTPIVELGQDDETAQYAVTMSNFLSASQGKSSFVDVLPYNRDDRGTSISGAVTLASAALSADESLGATLQITTDTAVRNASTAPAASVQWIEYSTATTEQIAAATAIRVSIADFISGSKSVVILDYSLNVNGARSGDVLQNTVNGMLNLEGTPNALAEAQPVQVQYVAYPPVAGDASVVVDQGESATIRPVVTPGSGAVTDVTFADGSTSKMVDGQGTWSIGLDGDGNVVATFEPVDGFAGEADAQIYVVTDANGLTAQGSLSVEVRKPVETAETGDQHDTTTTGQPDGDSQSTGLAATGSSAALGIVGLALSALGALLWMMVRRRTARE